MVVSLGGSVGVVVGGWLGDRMGRRYVVAWSLVMTVVFAGLHVAIPHGGSFVVMLALRALLGVPYGILAVIIVPYMIEFFSDDVRGCAACGINLGWPLGNVFGIQMTNFARGSWRVCL